MIERVPYDRRMTAWGPMPGTTAPGYRRHMIATAGPPFPRRLSPRDLLVIDALTGAVLGVLALLHGFGPREAAVVSLPTVVIVALTPVLGAAVALRRRYPWPALWAVALASPFVAQESQKFPLPVPAAMALVLYTLAVRTPRSVSVRGLGVLVGCTALGVVAVQYGLLGPHLPNPAVFDHAMRMEVLGLLLLTLPLSAVWMIGVAVSANRAYTAGLQAQAEQRARELVVEERLRIARELHDIVAHNLSLITMQASVAGFVAGTRPEEAVRALTLIEQTGRDALHEMRRLLGMLRDGDGNAQDPELVPAPRLADLDQLVARTAESGLRVELRISGERRELPAPLELAVYRIAQEALTNVIKHADATRVRTVLTYGEDSVGIEVVDDGRGAGADAASSPGHGLVGMRERVAVYGGELETGPLPDGGFRVTARIPLEAGS
ncbi:sensor histidine kinase [Kitasatospora sp. NPDC001175]|uniref:sensor histidine kinase n=1 Tax=Kitasatospora sp. NPDC001175 TaxID=3157103 RepID=UPI003D037596